MRSDQGRVSTTSPGNLTEEDLGALIRFWQTRPARGPNRRGRPGARLDQATWGRYLSDLQGFLEGKGNGIVAAIKRKHRLPRPSKGIRVFDNEELERLRSAAEAVPGWTGVTARFMVAFLPATGLRRKEFRLAFKHSDPRFHSSKDMFILFVRRDNSSVPPENAILIPIAKRAEMITLQKGQGQQLIQPLEQTSPRQRVPGRL